jgi:hypothetical protein
MKLESDACEKIHAQINRFVNLGATNGSLCLDPR